MNVVSKRKMYKSLFKLHKVLFFNKIIFCNYKNGRIQYTFICTVLNVWFRYSNPRNLINNLLNEKEKYISLYKPFAFMGHFHTTK